MDVARMAIDNNRALAEVFWPDLPLGRLAVGAILSSDFPMAQGTIIVLSLGFIIVNLVVDVLYVALDPRMRGH